MFPCSTKDLRGDMIIREDEGEKAKEKKEKTVKIKRRTSIDDR